MWKIVYQLLPLILTNALPRPNPTQSTNNSNMLINCANIFGANCLKIRAISLIESLNAKEELKILPGLTVVKHKFENGTLEEAVNLARSLPGKEDSLDSYLISSLGRYLDSHAVRVKLFDHADVGEARKKDKKGGMGGLMTAGLLMKGTLMSIGMGGLAMLAGKALLTALMSLMLSAIIGLKSLTSGGGKSTTYEIVSKPVYSHSHSHSTAHEDVPYGGHSGYGRSMDAKARRR